MRVDLDTAAKIAGVAKGTIRSWVHQGVVVRYPDGYDTQELQIWLDQRSTAALCARIGLPQPQDAAALSDSLRAQHARREAPVKKTA